MATSHTQSPNHATASAQSESRFNKAYLLSVRGILKLACVVSTFDLLNKDPVLQVKCSDKENWRCVSITPTDRFSSILFVRFLVVLFRCVYLFGFNSEMWWKSCVSRHGRMAGHSDASGIGHYFCISFTNEISWYWFWFFGRYIVSIDIVHRIDQSTRRESNISATRRARERKKKKNALAGDRVSTNTNENIITSSQ